MQEVRTILYRWVASVMAERGWSAAVWARQAGIAPTSLTRFLRDPASASVPSAETIARLARAAGSEPSFLGDDRRLAHRIPILDYDQTLRLITLPRSRRETFLAELARGSGACIMIEGNVSPRAFGVSVTSGHMNAGGVLPQDNLVVEPADLLPPRPGDPVVVLDDAAVCCYRFYPPHLMPVSTDPLCVPRACDEPILVGVAIHATRALRY